MHAGFSGRTTRDSTLRWAVNTRVWDPTLEEIAFLSALLPGPEQSQVGAFRFPEDRKRALVSRLLQRQCIATALGVPWADVLIGRTRAHKPYFANAGWAREHAPNFNYNVSHEGDYVVLASEPLCICGIDVAAPQQHRGGARRALQEVFSDLEAQLTAYEWGMVRAAGPDDAAMEDMFRQYWSLKEAYVKARGDGLGFDLGRAEFRILTGEQDSRRFAQVLVDGLPQPRWRFHLQRLGAGHWAAVARGPPGSIVDADGAFRATLLRPQPSEYDLQCALDAPNPPFEILTVGQLLPPGAQEKYESFE